MPHPDETHAEAKRLEARLEAAESSQAQRASGETHRAMAQGYRFIGEVVGGVLMGAGLGWLLDRLVGTGPWGLVGGLLIGTGLSIFVAVRTATRITNIDVAKAGPAPVVVADDQDED